MWPSCSLVGCTKGPAISIVYLEHGGSIVHRNYFPSTILRSAANRKLRTEIFPDHKNLKSHIYNVYSCVIWVAGSGIV